MTLISCLHGHFCPPLLEPLPHEFQSLPAPLRTRNYCFDVAKRFRVAQSLSELAKEWAQLPKHDEHLAARCRSQKQLLAQRSLQHKRRGHPPITRHLAHPVIFLRAGSHRYFKKIVGSVWPELAQPPLARPAHLCLTPEVIELHQQLRICRTGFLRHLSSVLLRHRVPILRRISSRKMKFQLSFNVAQHAACAESEQMRLHPAIPQLFLHQRQPLDGLLCCADSASRFESHRHPCLFRVFPNRSRHYQANRQSRVNALLSRRRLDEVRPGHHRHQAGPRYVAQRRQVSRPQNDLKVCRAARVFKRHYFVVQLLPLRPEHVRARYYHVNFPRPRFDRSAHFGNPLFQRIQPCWKTRRNRSHGNLCAFQRPPRRFHEQVIHAHSSHLYVQALNPQFSLDFLLDRVPRLRTQPPHALIRVVTRKSGQVHTRDGSQQPRDLPILLHRSPGHQSRRPPFHRARIHTDVFHPIEIQRRAAIGCQPPPIQRGDCSLCRVALRRDDPVTLPVRNFQPRLVLRVHRPAPDGSISDSSANHEHTTAPHAARTSAPAGSYRFRIAMDEREHAVVERARRKDEVLSSLPRSCRKIASP